MELRSRIRSIDWVAVAGIMAAVAALILHFLHIIEEGVLLSVALVLIALLFVRDLRREHETEDIARTVDQTERLLREVRAGISTPDVELVGPNELREASSRFGRNARGDMIWFHVCLLMFRPQRLFDDLLKPAIENPDVCSIQFVLDESVSFILGGSRSGTMNALLSFWGEPFMSRTTEQEVPRYIFRVSDESELITRFREMERTHRFQSG